MQNNDERNVIERLHGRGAVYAGGEKAAEVHYTLTVTGDVVVVPVPGEEAGERSVSGEIEVFETTVDLQDVERTLTLVLEDGRTLLFAIADVIPGGYFIEGLSALRAP